MNENQKLRSKKSIPLCCDGKTMVAKSTTEKVTMANVAVMAVESTT